MKTLVVGAGIGGLGAGIALTQRGLAVDVVEIKPEFSVYGVGINQPANSLRALRSLGVLERCLAVGYQFDQCDFFGADGEHLVNIPYGFSGEDVPCNNALSRLDLHRILLERAEDVGIKVHYDTSVRELTDRGDAVEVELTDARHEVYDLVVAFDGIKSWTRRTLFGDEFEPVYSGFGVLRITLPRPADVTGMRVYQALGVKVGFCPLSENSMYMFVVTAQPPDVVHDPATLGELLRGQLEPFGDLPARVRETLNGAAGIVYSPISDVMLPLPWFTGRVGVLGDAAHACAPHLTQGAGMALEDGVVLAEMLAGDEPMEQTLRAFGQRRFPRAKLVQDVSHQILANEMAITADNYDQVVEAMRVHLPAQSRAVDRLLDVPA